MDSLVKTTRATDEMSECESQLLIADMVTTALLAKDLCDFGMKVQQMLIDSKLLADVSDEREFINMMSKSFNGGNDVKNT